VLPPSVHVLDDFVYRWETFGEIVEVSWRWLQENFGFESPQQSKKELPWHLKFEGNLRWLDLRGLLEAIGYSGRPVGEGKHAIFCPWRDEHTTEIEETAPSGATVVWQHGDGSAWPGFKCLHAHCGGRGLRELLKWAESQEKGIVDRFCSQSRVWRPGQVDENGRPKIPHPYGRLDSEVHSEVGRIISPGHEWFMRGDKIVLIDKVPSGFVHDCEHLGGAFALCREADVVWYSMSSRTGLAGIISLMVLGCAPIVETTETRQEFETRKRLRGFCT
jgi:hypothetical protein